MRGKHEAFSICRPGSHADWCGRHHRPCPGFPAGLGLWGRSRERGSLRSPRRLQKLYPVIRDCLPNGEEEIQVCRHCDRQRCLHRAQGAGCWVDLLQSNPCSTGQETKGSHLGRLGSDGKWSLFCSLQCGSDWVMASNGTVEFCICAISRDAACNVSRFSHGEHHHAIRA